MQRAIVKVTVLVQLDIDTDRPVIALDQSVLNSLRKNVEFALEKVVDMGPVELGHYVGSIAVPFAELDK